MPIPQRKRRVCCELEYNQLVPVGSADTDIAVLLTDEYEAEAIGSVVEQQPDTAVDYAEYAGEPGLQGMKGEPGMQGMQDEPGLQKKFRTIYSFFLRIAGDRIK